jgi:mannosidase alpha-like ER degradation enhancer 1
LSAHQLAVELFSDIDSEGRIYDGELLLNLAITVGNALLPAFETTTGVPIHKVNLIKGVNKQERTYTCTAAGTSFLLEMGLLSRLTGNPVYESVARKSLQSVWDKRSEIDLVGGLIDVHTGQWLEGHTSIGIKLFYKLRIVVFITYGFWLGLCVLRRIYRQDYETLFHVVILSKHHHHQVRGWIRFMKLS